MLNILLIILAHHLMHQNQNKSNEIMKSVDTQRLTTNLDYNLRFPSDNYIEAFKWMSKVPL